MMARGMDSARDGFTLVEALMAMLLSTVVLMSLAPALLHVAGQQRVFQGTAAADGVLLAEANRFAAIPFDELPQEDECVSVELGEFPHTRCVTVVSSSTRRRGLTIVVTPLRSGLSGDTITVDRRRPRKNPLNGGAS